MWLHISASLPLYKPLYLNEEQAEHPSLRYTRAGSSGAPGAQPAGLRSLETFKTRLLQTKHHPAARPLSQAAVLQSSQEQTCTSGKIYFTNTCREKLPGIPALLSAHINTARGPRRGSEGTGRRLVLKQTQRDGGQPRGREPRIPARFLTAPERRSWKGRGGMKGSGTPTRRKPRSPARIAPLSAEPARRAAHTRTDAPSAPCRDPLLAEAAAAPYVTRPPRAPRRRAGNVGWPGREGSGALRNGAPRHSPPPSLQIHAGTNCRTWSSADAGRLSRCGTGRCEGRRGAESGQRPVRRGPEPALSALRTPQPRGAASRAHRRRRRCPRRRRAAPQPPARLPPRPAPRAASPPLVERYDRRAAIGRARPPPRRHWLRRSAVRDAPERRRSSAPRQPGSGAGRAAGNGAIRAFLRLSRSVLRRSGPPRSDLGRPRFYAPRSLRGHRAPYGSEQRPRRAARPPHRLCGGQKGRHRDLRLQSLQPRSCPFQETPRLETFVAERA